MAAITSRIDEDVYPTEIPVKAPEGGLSRDSMVLLNQIRSIDRSRLVRRMGRLRAETMVQVDRALTVSLGLVPI